MKVYIKNRISFGGDSTVKNENKEDVFFVKGRFMSPTRVKFVCDINGNTLYKVRNRFFNYFGHRAYIYDENGTKIASVKNPFLSIKKFIVEDYKDDIVIDGEFFSRFSTIMRNGEEIGKINREFSLINDHFCLEADEADIPFLIALVIAIDNISDKKTTLWS